MKLIPLKNLKLAPVIRYRSRSTENKLVIHDNQNLIPDDFTEFCSKIKIKSGGKLVAFELYKYQEQIYQSVVDNKITQILKTRQTGLSELALFILAYNAVKNPAFTGIFVSYRQDKEVKSAAKKFRWICDQIEKVYGIKRTSEELFAPSFENGGQVLFRAGLDPDNAVGESSVSMIVYDEAALYDFLRIMSYAEPCMTMLGDRARTLIISTPRLKTDDYGTSFLESNPIDILDLIEQVRSYKVDPVQEVVDDQGWHKFIVHWKAHPIYGNDDRFLEKKVAEAKTTEAEVLREYDLCFDILGEILFTPTLIHRACRGEWQKERLENCHYYLGIDPQFGGADYAVCVVLKHDLRTGEFSLIDWYRKNFEGKTYHITRICELIDTYNPEAIAIEINNGGEAWLDDLLDIYPDKTITGVRTSEANKATMITRLIILLEQERLIFVPHPEIKKEFSIFQKKGKQLSAPAGKHDDIVMAFGISTNVLPINLKKTTLDFDKIQTTKEKSIATYAPSK